MKIKIKKNDLKLWFLIIPFFQPMCFDYVYTGVGRFYSTWLVLSIAVIWFIYFRYISLNIMQTRHMLFIVALMAYFTWYALSTIINEQSLTVNMIGRWLSIVSFCMLTQLGYKLQQIEYVDKVSRLLQILVWTNFIVYAFNPHGLAQTSTYGNYIHFLANKNGLTSIYIFMYAFILTSQYATNVRMSFYKKIYVIVLSFTIIPFGSGTGILCSAIFVITVLLGVEHEFMRVLTYAKTWLVYITTSILLVFMQITSFFNPIFELVNKDSTLTGRIYIWKEAISMIKSSLVNLILGYGNMSDGYIKYNGIYYTSHNMILEMLLRGGVFALVLFGVVVLITKHHTKSGVAGRMLSSLFWCLLMYLLGTLTEPLISVMYLYGILCLINTVSVETMDSSSYQSLL